MKKENCIKKTKNRTTLALILVLPFILMEWYMRANGLYATMPYLDKPVHFLFGVGVAGIVYLIYSKEHNPRLVLWWAFILSMIWEMMEIIGDQVIPQSAGMTDLFFFDGFFDIVVSVIGAYLTYLFIKKRN